MTPLRFTLTRALLLAAAHAPDRRTWPRFVAIHVAFAAVMRLALPLPRGGGHADAGVIAALATAGVPAR